MSAVVARRRAAARRARKGGTALRVALIVALALASLGAIGAAAGLGTAFAVYQHYADDYVPIQEKLQQTHVGLTEIYDRNGPESGKLLGVLPNPDSQLLSPVPLTEISTWMVEATVSTEDNSFWDHPGVNLRGLIRAAYENYVLDDFGQGTGGSSITQQLIKNVYICPSIGDNICTAGAERTLDRKLREIAYAIELEQDYSKEQVLEWYLNQTAYADRYVGVQAAAEGYFHKQAKDLTLAEAALLAGIPSYPTKYHPRLNCVLRQDIPDECVIDGVGRTLVGRDAKARQEEVLDLMVRHGRITLQEANTAKAEDLRVYQSVNRVKAAGFIDNQVEPRLVRMCEHGILPKLESATTCAQSVHGAGYRVTTTLDLELTDLALALAQERIAIGIEIECDCHNASVVTIDPNTGQVLVYVPNIDPNGDTIDPRVRPNIDQATEIQQPGSSFKPAVYLTWFDHLDKNPMSIFWDTSPLEVQGTSIENPRTGELKSEGLISARAALGGSQNVGAFRAAYEAGVDNVIEMAKKLGITTLDQHFDPTFLNHAANTYGASIATGGANIRVIDMAYMNTVFANMGVMVGVPHLARYVPLSELKSTTIDTGAGFELAEEQELAFARGHIRIPGTRELDPVVVLEVRNIAGEVVYDHETAGDLERLEVVNPGSVWLLYSIMSDCSARYIIWGCGGENTGSGLDPYMGDGTLIPGGLKTGTQQGYLRASDTLETWMNGYSRYAGTAVWVGNANNALVQDGPGANYAAANTTKALYRTWMGLYHDNLKARGVFSSPEGFASLQPSNVRRVEYASPATSTGGGVALNGGCDQMVTTWVRTDVTYDSECEEREIDTRNGLLAGADTPAQYREKRKFVKLPDLKPELVKELVEKFTEAYPEKTIPVAPTETSTGANALVLTSPTNGAVVGRDTDVVGSVGPGNLVDWKLEIGPGGSPTSWKEIGAGKQRQSNAILGRITIAGLKEGIYTVRLTAKDRLLGNLSVSVSVNIRPGASGGGPTPRPGTPTQTPRPGTTPTPGGAISHPIGYEECDADLTCGGGIIVVRCGPLGWFVDLPRVGIDYGGRDWPVFVVQNAADAPGRAAVSCGP